MRADEIKHCIAAGWHNGKDAITTGGQVVVPLEA